MRWIEPQTGTTRIRSGFLWFPKTIYHETRWWEKARWVEMYWRSRGWVLECWTDKET